MLVSQATGRPN